MFVRKWNTMRIRRIHNGPITKDEFLAAVESTCPSILPAQLRSTARCAEPFPATEGPGKPRLWRSKPDPFAIAVSGGVDSMALAYLCSEHIAPFCDRKSPIAFIIDHKLRESSDAEAKLTQRRLLDQLRLKAEVLSISDGNEAILNVTTPKTKAVETWARKLRFRLLGIACRKRGGKMILTAHHSDDDAETILMKLPTHRFRLGLQNIPNDIPECFGLYGVHKSGGALRSSEFRTIHNGGVAIESGGIKVAHPLLSFSKERLVATCREAGVNWCEDHTNRMKCLTKRNVARALLAEGHLPKPLQKKSLLLFAKTSALLDRRLDAAARMLFHASGFKLDPRYGVLDIWLPHGGGEEILNHPSLAGLNMEQVRITLAIFLDKILAIVSPQEHTGFTELGFAIDQMFPMLQVHCDSYVETSSSPTIHGVQIRRITESIENWGFKINDRNLPLPHGTELWRLHRQNFSRRDLGLVEASDEGAMARGLLIKFPPVSVEKRKGAYRFQLWDGRFWIRVLNPTPATFYVQPITTEIKKKMAENRSLARYYQFKGRVSDYPFKGPAKKLLYDWKSISNQIHNMPGSIPALVAEWETEWASHWCVVGLPTLGIAYYDNELMQLPGWMEIRWEVRYKSVDFGSLDPVSCISSCTSRNGDVRKHKLPALPQALDVD